MNKKYLVITGIVVLIALVGIFAFKSFTGKAIDTPNKDVRVFTVKAFRFGYTPNVITVNKGDKVKIIIDNIDTLHGIRIPDLGIKGDEVLEFTADKTGEFTWYCANQCGKGHMQMQGKLIVK